MGVIFLLFVLVSAFAGSYLFQVHIKKIDWKAFKISVALCLAIAVLFGVLIFKFSNPRDTWCDHFRVTNSYPPPQTVTAMDWFEKGNYEYDSGKCKEAVISYTKSIELNGKYPQAYNNKAFTEMKMADYQSALNDLNIALTLNPNYINALMNRGDIYNFYIKNRVLAMDDYNKIISLVGTKGTGACGRIFLAKHDGWNLRTMVSFPMAIINCQKGR